MLHFFRNLSIAGKLTSLVMGTCCATLVVVSVMVSSYERSVFRRELLENVTILAKITGANATSALEFNDSASALSTLQALRAEPNIKAARIYDRDRNLFAQLTTDELKAPTAPVMEVEGHEFTENRLSVFQKINSGNETLGMLCIESDLEEMWERMREHAVIWFVVGLSAVLMAYIVSKKLQGKISKPIHHLADMAAKVAHKKDYSIRARKFAPDEMGQLTESFNEMLFQIQQRDMALQNVREDLEKRVEERTRDLNESLQKIVAEIEERKATEARLETVHRELMEASRIAGRAEVATGVLHNVGNVLNSVNVSASLVVDVLEQSRVKSLHKLAALFTEHSKDLGAFFVQDPRAKEIPAYVNKLADQLDCERTQALAEVQLLRKNIEHIKEIVAMQQNYAKLVGVTETVRINDVVDDALSMNEGAMVRHQVRVIKEYCEIPPMELDRHKILQIMVNLLRNAKYACDESSAPEKTIKVRISRNAEHISVEVIDNGIGIPQENLTRIFAHGFTTRKEGHGFGLHNSALGAIEMGGALSADSGGVGKGATFTLQIPIGPSPTVKSMETVSLTSILSNASEL